MRSGGTTFELGTVKADGAFAGRVMEAAGSSSSLSVVSSTFAGGFAVFQSSGAVTTSIEPIDEVSWWSKIGSNVVPRFVVFQSPPVAKPT